MVIAGVSVVPIGTNTPSLSAYVAKAVKVLSQEDLKKGSGFAAVEQASTDLAKALESFGTVTKTPPRKDKGSWGGAPVLQSVVKVKNGEKNAEFMLKADIERGTVNVSLRWSEPRLDYGVGAEFDIYRKRWDSDQFDRLLRSMGKVFEEPQALAASALLAAHKAVAEARALLTAARPIKLDKKALAAFVTDKLMPQVVTTLELLALGDKNEPLGNTSKLAQAFSEVPRADKSSLEYLEEGPEPQEQESHPQGRLHGAPRCRVVGGSCV